jgi:hypothetical protein
MKYSGIGSRKIKTFHKRLILNTAVALSNLGVDGISGGADGSDKNFQEGSLCGIRGNFKTMVPFPGFIEYTQHNRLKFVNVWELDNYSEARYIASQVHPTWNKLSRREQEFHTRNVYEILDEDLNSPVDFVIACAPPIANKIGQVEG